MDLTRAEAEADEAIAFLEAEGDDLGAARAWRLKGNVRWNLMDSAGRVSASERAAVLARRAGAGWDEAEAMLNVVFGPFRGDVPIDDCRRRTSAILNEARTSGNLQLEADALGALGVMAADRGESDLARALLAESERLRLEVGRQALYWAARSEAPGEIEWLFGNLRAAESMLRKGDEALGRLGETGFRSTIAADLGLVLADQGQLDEALRFVDGAETLGGPWDLVNLILAGIARAKVCVMRGRPDEAIDEAERAVEVGDRGDDLRHQGLARLALAEALHAAGRDDEAVAAARDALDRFERKGSIVLADRARAFLVDLDALT